MNDHNLQKATNDLINRLYDTIQTHENNKRFLVEILDERNKKISKLEKRIAELESSEVVKWK